MRNSRFVVALAAVACAAALPAVAAAHKGHPFHGHPGKGKHGNSTVVRLAPAAGQTAKGVVVLTAARERAERRVARQGADPGQFYASHLHSGSCLAQGASAVTFPDLYADERGVAKLVTTVPTTPARTSWPPASTSTCTPARPRHDGAVDLLRRCQRQAAQKSAALTWLKGANGVHGRAEVFQKGSDVTVWISVSGLTTGPHAVHLHAGTCACRARSPSASATSPPAPTARPA